MITINKQSCDLCGTCVSICPVDALIIEINELTINYDRCINCSHCIYICPIDALSEDRHEL